MGSMEEVQIRVKRLRKDRSLPLPQYMTLGSSGMDLFAFLEKELRVAFEGQDEVKVTVDRRKVDRRKSSRHVSSERRKVNRRRSKAELLEVVIAT